MGKRFITRIELNAASLRWLAEYHKANGMTQVAVLSRLVHWFADQPAGIQQPILANRNAQWDDPLVERILKRFADGKPAVTVPVRPHGKPQGKSRKTKKKARR